MALSCCVTTARILNGSTCLTRGSAIVERNLGRQKNNVGGRESAETVRKRQLLWREQNRKAWWRLRSGQKARYYSQFQKNTRHRIPSRPTCLTVPTNLWMQQEKKFDAGRDVSSTPRSLIRSFQCETLFGRACVTQSSLERKRVEVA
jgi:hypothetical protein